MEKLIIQQDTDIQTLLHMLDHVTDLVFLMEYKQEQFIYRFINKKARAILQLSDETLGLTILAAHSPEKSVPLHRAYSQVAEREQMITFRQKVKTNEGLFVGVSKLTPIFNSNLQLTHVLGIVEDISSLQETELELATSRQTEHLNKIRMQSFINYNGRAVYELNNKGEFIQLNDMALEITGYDKEELMNSSFAPLIHPDYLEMTHQKFIRGFLGAYEEYYAKIVHKQGHYIDVHITNIPILIDGEVETLVGFASDVTEETKLKQEAELTRERYKSLFDFHPDGIIAYNLQGQLIDGNIASSTITGYQFDEARSRSFTSFILPEYAEQAFKSFEYCLKAKQSVKYEVALYHKQGHTVYVSVMNIPIIVNEELIGVYGVFKDISRERELDRKLRQKNIDLETLWNTAINPIFQLAIDGRITRVNPAFTKLFEYTEEEIINSFNQIVPEHLLKETKELEESLMKFQPIELYETQRITKSGKIVDILASYTPFFNENKEPMGIHVVYNNITKLKNIQRELDQSREKYKVITEHAFDIIKVFNRNGRIDYVSPSIQSLLGYEPYECIGQRFTQFIHIDDYGNAQKHLQLLLATREHSTMELRLKHKDGHYIWMEVNASPVIERNRVVNIITISRDISERYRNQEALKQMAYYDHLSGLPNRRAFDDRLQELLEDSQTAHPLAMLLIDGNQFKQINDTYGHDAGDAVIAEVAKRLSDCVRQEDLVARLGGDEIGILIENVQSRNQVNHVIQRIIDSFNQPFKYKEHTLLIRIGIGAALFPEDAQDKKALFIATDKALYESKKTVETNYTFYEEVEKKR